VYFPLSTPIKYSYIHLRYHSPDGLCNAAVYPRSQLRLLVVANFLICMRILGVRGTFFLFFLNWQNVFGCFSLAFVPCFLLLLFASFFPLVSPRFG
jgi:hypothetical protein